MSPRMNARIVSLVASLVLFSNALPLSAQQTGTPAPDDVIRVNTELVQTPVTVFDKQGNFVSGLTQDQFELKINGAMQAVSSFEEMTAGTLREFEKYQLGNKPGAEKPKAPATLPSFAGRTVLFFLDDLHLGADSVIRTRTALLNYIDHSLGQNDRAMIVAASGQIGFLQQLTDNKDVLRAALDRFKHRDFTQMDDSRPPMTAYQALAIENGDSGTLEYFADMIVKDDLNKQLQPPAVENQNRVAEAQRRSDQMHNQAENTAKNRARNLLNRYSTVSTSSLTSLKQTIATLNQLPGSKLVFLISDGFFLNQQRPSEIVRLNEITSTAVRTGAVVYSIQASGLNTSMTDAAADVRLGPNGNLPSTMIGQDGALQGPLYSLAADTGGQAFFNNNSMDQGIGKALQETSRYYLLAWRPDPNEKRTDQFQKVQVSVKGHPEWSVRMQSGYYLAVNAPKPTNAQSTTPNNAQAAASSTEASQKADKMRETISALFPVRDLPTLVNVSFMDRPAVGPVINVGTEFSLASLLSETDKQPFWVDLIGVVLDDNGKTVASFSGQMKFDPASSGPATLSHLDELKVKPGLYQVRVATREDTRGINGSAADWILVPDLADKKVRLSSLLIGDLNSSKTESTSADQKARLSINHHFSRAGRLRFFTDIYNAARGLDGKSAPDLTVQLRLMRNNQVVSQGQPMKLATDGLEDLARVPYAAEITLAKLPPGSYALFVTATDNTSKSNATQSVKFIVE
jgi:VWFA-related protein